MDRPSSRDVHPNQLKLRRYTKLVKRGVAQGLERDRIGLETAPWNRPNPKTDGLRSNREQ